MTELAAIALAPSRPSRAGLTGRLGGSLLALALLGVGFADLFNSANISLGLALAGGLALVGFLTLTISHYDTAIAIGLLLMGIVRFEPAPPDIAFAVIMSVAAMTGRFRLNRVPLILRWIVGLLLILNLLSMMDVVNTSIGLRFLFITVYLVIFSLWLTGYVDSPSRARLVVVTWLVIGVASAIISAAALNLPVPGRSFILGSVDNSQRASGFFKDPNVFGPFLIPIALILLEQRIAPRSPRLLRMRGSTTWLCLLALTLGILLAYSRAAWLNFGLALLIMLAASAMRRKGARRALRALSALLLIGGATAVILSATGSIGFLEHRAQLHQSYDNGRFAAQHLGWELGWTHPVGIGPGQFESYSPVAAQSTFVRVFSEQGPMALLLWVAMLLVTLVLAVRNVAVGRDTYGIGSAALLGAWCGMILNSTVVDTLHWRHMWVVAALIWASTARDPATRPAPARDQLALGRPRRLAVAPGST
jgi:hypothetical protein